jgi:predicted metal-dependent hydrolase
MKLFQPTFADGDVVQLGEIPVRLRVSRRSRRISLRIDAARREAVAVAPSLRDLPRAAAFARARAAWLAARLAATPPAVRLAAGDTLVIFGAPTVLQPDGRRPRLVCGAPGERQRLVGCGAGDLDFQLVVRGVRRQAQRVFQARAGVYCATLAVPAPPIAVTDARTRWGSCTPARGGRGASIRLSWRLALAPVAVADYVVAHECAHLLEPNHGPGFWKLVRGLVGDERPHRAWLRGNGAALHLLGA